jgi:hypothetical protein
MVLTSPSNTRLLAKLREAAKTFVSYFRQSVNRSPSITSLIIIFNKCWSNEKERKSLKNSTYTTDQNFPLFCNDYIKNSEFRLNASTYYRIINFQ